MESAKSLLKTLVEQIAPKHTALLVIDPQNDFLASNGALARAGFDVKRMQSAVPRLNHFIQKAREAGVTVIWVRIIHDSERMVPSQKVMWGEGDAIAVVKKGSQGIDWYSEISGRLPNEHVITKWNYDAFESITGLDLLLRNRGIRTLLLTGFGANVCVETTARHGFIKGYYIVLVSDCTDAATQQEYEATVFNIKNFFGKVATSNEIVSTWGLDVS